MQQDIDVLVIGELNPDLILSGDVAPVFGQVEKFIDDATLTLGSSSAICACGMARLGLRVAFIGKVGDDMLGRFCILQLIAHNVDSTSVVIDPSVKTGLGVILSRGVDRAILTYSGSIGALRYPEISTRKIAQARHLHMGGYFLLDQLRPDVPKLFELSHRLGLSVSLDTNYDPTEQWDGGLDAALQHTDIFLPNEAELRAITARDHPEPQDAETGSVILAGRIPTLAVKLGQQGAIAHCQGHTERAQALAVEVKDTTGAGDTFDAGFIFGQLKGWSLRRSLQLACVCGSLSTRAAGGVDGQPTLAEALAWLEPESEQ